MASDTAASAARLWEEFLASDSPYAAGAAERAYTAWSFGANAAMADDLLALVLEGKKRATTGALWTYQAEGETVPVEGDFSIVTDGAGVARCVIRTTGVDIVPFSAVGPDFAAAEGEGDLSLDYWREGHWRYFTRELAGFGKQATEDMPLVCERFELVYRAK